MASMADLPTPDPPGGSGDSRLRSTSTSSSTGVGGSGEGRRSSLPPRRRSSSARRSPSRSPQAAYLEEEEDDEDHGMRVPLEPPSSAPLDEELDEIIAARVSGEHSLGGWHYAPLIVGIGPALGAILGGKADLWSDAILLLLSSFWLFQCLKIPNDIYYAARTRRILQDDQNVADEGFPADSPERKRRCQTAVAELQRTEVIALAACVVSPIVGAYVLNWLQLNLHDGSRYLNRFNIRLFMMAAGIRPWLHLFKLIRRRTLLLQEDVHYPSARVESMKRRIARLEADISALRKTTVSRSDVRLLRDGIDVPLSQMSRSMRKYERKEENLRNLADDKFALVEARLEDLLRECAINAELIEAERLERERSSSLGKNILEAFKYALGQQRNSTASLGHRAYLTDGRSPGSFAGITAPPPLDSPGSSGGGSGGMLSPEMLKKRSTSWSGKGPSAEPLSPPTTRHRAVSQPLPPSPRHSTGGPGEWYEQGVLYWAFLPLNVSNSMLRFAGEKLAGKESSLSRSGSSGSNGSSASIARRSSLSARAAAAAGIVSSSASAGPSSRIIAHHQPSTSTSIREEGLPSSPPSTGTGHSSMHTSSGSGLGSGFVPTSSRAERREQQPSIHINTSPTYENGSSKYSSAFLASGGSGASAGSAGGALPFGQLSLNQNGGGASSPASWRRAKGVTGQRGVKV